GYFAQEIFSEFFSLLACIRIASHCGRSASAQLPRHSWKVVQRHRAHDSYSGHHEHFSVFNEKERELPDQELRIRRAARDRELVRRQRIIEQYVWRVQRGPPNNISAARQGQQYSAPGISPVLGARASA